MDPGSCGVGPRGPRLDFSAVCEEKAPAFQGLQLFSTLQLPNDVFSCFFFFVLLHFEFHPKVPTHRLLSNARTAKVTHSLLSDSSLVPTRTQEWQREDGCRGKSRRWTSGRSPVRESVLPFRYVSSCRPRMLCCTTKYTSPRANVRSTL